MWFFPSPRAFSLNYEFVKIWVEENLTWTCNEERVKKETEALILNLVVSIPRNLLHIHVCPELNLSLCSEEPSVDDPHLSVYLRL